MLRISLVLAAALLACGPSQEERAQELARAHELAAPEPACRSLRKGSVPDRGSLVVIVSDTMRRDAAGIYGGPARTPHFDAFGRQHLLFERAVSQAPWTKPAIATLFSSAFPSEHGVSDDPRRDGRQRHPGLKLADVLSPDFLTLAELLEKKGFRTAAFMANPWMDERFGFAQGFQRYDDSFAKFDAPGELVSEAAAAWLAGIPSHERFFLFVHYIDAHRPYGKLDAGELEAAREELEADARPMDEEVNALMKMMTLSDGRSARDAGIRASPTLVQMAYRRGVENFDRALGGMLRALEDHPLYPKTAIFITSDHGEALFSMGYGGHGNTLREDEIAIPMLARLPGVEAESTSVDCLAGLVDLMPTVCDYFDFECPKTVSGHSLLAQADGGSQVQSHYLVSEGVPRNRRLRSIQNRRYKLEGRIESQGERASPARRPGIDPTDSRIHSLYDLFADPEEENNLIDERSPQVDAIVSILGGALMDAVGPAPDVARGSTPLDEETQDRLRAIGYLGE